MSRHNLRMRDYLFVTREVRSRLLEQGLPRRSTLRPEIKQRRDAREDRQRLRELIGEDPYPQPAGLPIVAVQIGERFRPALAADRLHAALGETRPLLGWALAAIRRHGLRPQHDFVLPRQDGTHVLWFSLEAARRIAAASDSGIAEQLTQWQGHHGESASHSPTN
ncbi:hypothetical protein QR66_00045 [Chromobacterium piscinae]|nr:hypothetical protein QR66_00045 [Chromobacterium piscinae]